jgi:biopolymer transport protein ExbB
LRFAWRKQGGSRIALDLAADGKWEAAAAGGPSRRLVYFAGPRDSSLPKEAIPVHEPNPTDWVVVTRDLFVDFGPITLTGFRFRCPDGENALFDHIQVAQGVDQFEAPGK